jgi:hypothetical protein
LLRRACKLAAGRSVIFRESHDAYGGVKIGMKADLAFQQLKDYYSDKLSYDEPYSCYYLSPNKGGKGVHIMIVDGVVQLMIRLAPVGNKAIWQ